MKKPTRKQIILIAIGILVVALIIYGFLPGAKQVETDQVKSAPMQVTVEEEGETYVEEHYTISTHTAGFLRRIDLEPGDVVSEGDPVAVLEPPRPALLDPRSLAEAEARIEAAVASLEQAEIQAEQAITERNRVERLAREESATRQQLEQAQTEASRAAAARNAARAELLAARVAANQTPGERPSQPPAETLNSPVNGVVLSVHRRSEGPVNAGEPLIDIGDVENLEVRVEVLSQDAVRISRGIKVMLDQWGGEAPLEAEVIRVERQGKVVVSALGVEERRVLVTARLESPPQIRTGLGSGYRVLARFIIWEEEDVLQAPTSALFRTGDGWAVFVVENDRAARRTVTVGRQTGLSAQILDGLSEGDVVIVHPGSEIEDGVKVETD